MGQMLEAYSNQSDILPSPKGLLCPDEKLSCYQKLHRFYLPKKLFGLNPKLKFKENGLPETIAVSLSLIHI